MQPTEIGVFFLGMILWGFSNVVAHTDSLFLLVARHSLLNLLPIEGHLHCFQFGAIMNSVAMDICVQAFV